ncbi:uncharacterized protein KGF55_001509 [Candida pseudojiufengensis]|uniref:uncharacterized protein n=1 Tax=Candida pseudojiufengensis TaxID=497109 RepID=UPI0022253487|nr:uncharacterized protein KGF55_001509 [Candida pseudojiufengensis]KAI5965289.1 hypothetical protein KGF55_001509 [Candida pseudojiufengensis]
MGTYHFDVGEYNATAGIMNLIHGSLYNGASPGTGINNILNIAHNLMASPISPILIDYNVNIQNNVFGNYPTHADIAPSIVFAILFAITLVLHCFILIINTSRGHFFYLSYVWIFYNFMKVIGFALRAKWATDITLISIGLTSEIFLIVPAIIIVSANLILAQRLFTWRHPVGGSRKLFWGFMFVTYGFVLVLIAITVAASFVPYLHFLSWESYRNWIKVVQFTSIMVILYSLTSVALIGLSFWLPTKKDELRYTYQPWWIESFAPFYFVEKGAAAKAGKGFMKRNSNHRHATRVIAATHHHYHSVKGLSNQRGDLKHNISMGLLIITTLLILIGALGRCIVVFQARMRIFGSPATNVWFMYVCWGIFEVIINLLYIFGRVDLRFYRPDKLPKIVRAIITAEQTYYPSSDEEEDGFHRDRPETYDKIRGRAEHGYKNSASRMEPAHFSENDYHQSQHHPYADGQESAFEDDDTNDDFDDLDSAEWDFTVPKNEKLSSSSDEYEKSPPYPITNTDKKTFNNNNNQGHNGHNGNHAYNAHLNHNNNNNNAYDNDNESEFNF